MEHEPSFGSANGRNQETGLRTGYGEDEWKEQFELRKQSEVKASDHTDDQPATT